MPSTLEQRAQWRIQRAQQAGREPAPRDLDILEREKGIRENQESLSNLPPPPQSAQQVNQPLQLLPSRQSDQERGPGSKGTTPDRKLSGVREKSWHDFYSNRFGPLILLILWFCTADIDKASFYAPSPEECKTAAVPLAKITSKIEDWFSIPSWAHDILVSTDDMVTLGMVCMSYLDRVGMLEKFAPYFTGAAGRMRKMANEPKEPKEGPAITHSELSGNGHVDLGSIPGLGAQWAAN